MKTKIEIEIPVGWICPRCSIVLSPAIDTCNYCKPNIDNKKLELTEEQELLFIAIDDLDIKIRTRNILRTENFIYIGDIVCKNNWKTFLLRCPGLGMKSYKDFIKAVSEKGVDEYSEYDYNFDELKKRIVG